MGTWQWAKSSWLGHDRVAMPLTDQANDAPGPINNDGKDVHDIAAENAHIERVGLSEAQETGADRGCRRQQSRAERRWLCRAQRIRAGTLRPAGQEAIEVHFVK